MENAEIVETSSEELVTNGKTTAIIIAAGIAVGVGVAFVVNRFMSKREEKADEETLVTAAE
jgi:hypothetical protein